MSGKNSEEQNDNKLDLVLSAIDKKFGKGSIIRLDGDSIPDMQWVSSGCPGLDRALGGGYPRGRLIEIFGPESSGKTTLALHAVAEFQKQGLTAAFIDVEHAFDFVYAKSLNVNISKLLISQPDCGEDALEIVDMLTRSGEVGLIVVDSVAALVPKTELEGEMGDNSMGTQARLMSKAMRKLGGIASQSDTTILFTNQIRMKIGVMFGNPETVSGGNALKFYASQRLDIRRTEVLKGTGEEDKIGIRSRVKVVKNKVAPPFREAEFNIIFGEGIDWARDLLDYATEKNVIDKSGAWYSFGEERLGQGPALASKYLREHPDTVKTIKEQLGK